MVWGLGPVPSAKEDYLGIDGDTSDETSANDNKDSIDEFDHLNFSAPCAFDDVELCNVTIR